MTAKFLLVCFFAMVVGFVLGFLVKESLDLKQREVLPTVKERRAEIMRLDSTLINRVDSINVVNDNLQKEIQALKERKKDVYAKHKKDSIVISGYDNAALVSEFSKYLQSR